MSSALPGEHYCAEHQGNHSHYTEKNCTVCRLRAENERLQSLLTAEVCESGRTIVRLQEDSERLRTELAAAREALNEIVVCVDRGGVTRLELRGIARQALARQKQECKVDG